MLFIDTYYANQQLFQFSPIFSGQDAYVLNNKYGRFTVKRTKIFTGLVVAMAMFAGTVVASDHEAGMKIIPVELYACTYKEGQGPGDLEEVISMWTSWADKQGMEDYAAWTLTPFYYGNEQEFDVIWLGAGKDAVALGTAQDMYLEKGGKIAQGFAEVLDCGAHANFASINFKALPKGETPKSSVLTFSDCSYKEGATGEALGEAMGKWVAHLESEGSEAGIFHWYPAYGGGGEKFDFKWLQAHKNFAALGKDYDSYGTGGGYKTNDELFSDLISCDSTRAYVAKSRRYVQLR